jgi:hypothetical protein
MVSKVDQLSTVDFSWILLWIIHRISVGKWKNSYIIASKSSKNSEVNSRLCGRSEILQHFTFFEKVDQLSTFFKKIQRLSTVGQLSRNSRFIVKSRLSTSRLGCLPQPCTERDRTNIARSQPSAGPMPHPFIGNLVAHAQVKAGQSIQNKLQIIFTAQ